MNNKTKRGKRIRFGEEQPEVKEEPKKSLKQKIKTKAKSVTKSIHDHPVKASLAALAVVGAATVTAVSMGTLGPESAMVAGSAIAAVDAGAVTTGAGASLLTTTAITGGTKLAVKGGAKAAEKGFIKTAASKTSKVVGKAADKANNLNDITTAVNSGIDTVNRLKSQEQVSDEQEIQKGMTDISTPKNSFGKNYKKRKISKRQAIKILKKIYRKNSKFN